MVEVVRLAVVIEVVGVIWVGPGGAVMDVRCMVVVRWVGLAAVMIKGGWEVAAMGACLTMVAMMK